MTGARMSDQSNMKSPQEPIHEPHYCFDPDCSYCKQLREMKEQVSRMEADYRKNGYSP
jgi:hypothetical protein